MAWISIACAASLPFIYVSRFFVGIGNGILLSSVYSVEIATPEKRGAVVMVRKSICKKSTKYDFFCTK